MRSISALCTLLLLVGCARLPFADGGAEVPLPLAVETYGPARGSGVDTVVAILDDGDGLGAERAAFAQAIAGQLPDAAAVAILPPASAGVPSHILTIERIRAVGATIAGLRSRYPRARLVLVGHGTGAALAADVAGTHRALIDAMALVSCPCTLPEWRKHSKIATGDTTDLDPLQVAGGLDPAIRALILVGAEDNVTPPKFSRAYAEALALRGIATDFRVLPDRAHAILDDPLTIAAVTSLAASLSETPATWAKR